MKKIVAFIAVLIYMTCTGMVWGQTMSNPQDVTSKITNPGFDNPTGNKNALKVDGWEGTTFWDVDNCAEQWNRNFDFYQDIVNLPNGFYKVSVQGFYRDGNTGGANGKAQHAILYADDMEAPLMNILEEAGNSVITGDGTVEVSGYGRVPNSMATSNTAFAAGLYADNSVYVNVTDGTLRIGIKKETLITGDWTCFDNFKLTYWGSDNPYTGPTATYYLQNVATGEYLQGGAEYGVRPVLGNGIEFRVEKVYDGIYNLYSGIKHTEGYLCDEGYIDHGKTNFIIQEQSSGIYTIATTDEACNNLNPSYNGTFGRLLTVGDDKRVSFISGADASANASQWRFVTEAERIAALNEATRTNPKDATFLIKGASFTQGDQQVADKWKIDGGHWFYHYRDDGKQTDGAGGVVNLGVKSAATSCDIYQTVTGLPDGFYEVSMQGCHHNFKDAVFYADGVSVALDKCGDEFSSCINANHSSCTCRQTASVQTYGTDNYKKTLKVIVTDGTLRVGAKGSRSDLNNFLIFDNFTLSYLGTVGTQSYYVRNVATKDFIRAGGRYEAQAVRDVWGLALNFMQADNETVVIDSRISNAANYQYLGGGGYLDSGQTFFTLETVGDKYAIRTADGKYLATADGDNYVNFDRGIQSGDTHAQWELLTREQLIEELKNSGASDSNPKDATFLIEGSNLGRHDLRTNSTNWQGIDFTSKEYGGVESTDWNSQDNFANLAIEKFNKTFDTYQTISGLPAGTYELTVQGYYRSGNTATAADKANAGTDILRPFLYVKQEGKLIGQAPLQSIFDGGVANQTDGFSTSANGEWLPNSLNDAAKTFRDGHYMPSGEYNKVRFVVPSDGATVQIGVKKNVLYGSDWTAFDNFRLTYLGDTDETQTVYEHEIGEVLGTFYLKNAETGTYLTAGGDDGVSAVLGDKMYEHSIYEDTDNDINYEKGVRETDFTFVAVGADKFVIETGIGDGYLTRDNGVKLNGKPEPSKAFLTLRKNDNGNYYIFHDSGAERFLRYADNELYWGTSKTTTPGENFQWTFQTKEDLLAELVPYNADTAPNGASVNNPIDATFLLRGTAFHKDDSRNSAWTGIQSIGGEGGPDGVVHPNYVAEVSNVNTFNIYQKLTGIPNGVYEFTLQGYYKSGSHNNHVDAFSYMSVDERNYVHNVINCTGYVEKPNNKYEASSFFEEEKGTNTIDADIGKNRVTRIRVTDNMLVIGAFKRVSNAPTNSLYIDNVRLTYLGDEGSLLTPTRGKRGIHHKRSRYYELAEENGHLTFDDYNTVNEASNKTTLSNKTMVEHEHIEGRMVQHTPVYRDTIYARAGEKLEIVLPSAYTGYGQSSSRFYQRLYNYKTDKAFDDLGAFDFTNNGGRSGTYHPSEKVPYTDEHIKSLLDIYEGSETAPAGGWVFGRQRGQQLIGKFNFTTPTENFTSLTDAIEIAIDYTDLPDMGDMGMFGDLTEPTLVQRAIFVIVPSDEMVKNLSDCTGDKFLEVKSISFPTIWHGLYETDYNAVALDKQVRNYFTTAETAVDWKNISISLTNNGTGVTLNTTSFGSETGRFIKFEYPQGGEVTNLQTEYLTVQSGGKNIAKFILDFVPDTELRPWKDIMGQATRPRSPMYLDEHAQLIDVLNFDRSYSKDGKAVTHPSTWPIGDETSINGIERDTVMKNSGQFNPYPLDFDQTTFGAYYPYALWSQYSVMKRMHSYRNFEEFKDVNQLYHDYFSTQEGTDELLEKYQGGGYFMYIDASNFPSSVARLTMEEKLCAGTTIHFSGWVSSLDKTTNDDKNNDPGYLLFSIVGIDGDKNETVIESFCPGPIRADAQPYEGGKVGAEGYHADMANWDGSYSIWQQFAFSFVVNSDVASTYEEYALKIDNYCSSTSGGDMMVDDVRLYIHKAVPDVMQSVPVCSPGDMSGVKIYTDFDKLLSAVDMPEAASEQEAYNGYEESQAGGKIIPTAWYCFLDKKKYDDGIKALTSHTPADYDAVFNSALVTTGGGTGYHSFTFSTCYEANDGGLDSYRHTYTNSEGTSSTQVVTYAAGKGDGTDKRIYFNPESVVSLNTLSYYHLNNGTWNNVTPVWSLGNDQNGTVYGDNSGEPVRYVDLSAYDELRIYQSDADVDANGPVRCFFFPKEGSGSTNFKVSKSNADGSNADDRAPDLVFERADGYWVVDLEKVKDSTGQVKLITIKASGPDNKASVTAINVVRKSVELEPSKEYYIVFKAYKGETGETSVGGPSTFFNMTSGECAAMHDFHLEPNAMARFDGTLDSEGGDKYCAGQIATLKMEMQGFDSNNMAITLEDLPYDWWIGDKASFNTPAEGASPNNVLSAFREAYPEATTYEGQEAKGNFTSEYKSALEQWIKEGKLHLYKTSQNVRVENTDSDGQMEIIVVPILSFLENLTNFQYCDPIEVYINVSSSAPRVKDGFEDTNITYPDYMDEVPLRIGLAQIQSVKDEAADSWLEANNALYIPLRDIKFSGETGYTKGFGKKKHNWGTDSSNALDIAAVYLTETDDPAMVSYGDDVDGAGNRELRYVGKVHVFQAALNKSKFEDYVKLTFNPDFANNVKEGYRYVLKTSFEETNESGTANPCHGDLLIPLYIVPEYQVWAGGADGNWANDDNWRRADNTELKFATTTDRLTNETNTTVKGFVPMDFTNVLMKSDSVAVLNSVTKENDLVKFNETDGHTPDIQYHLVAKVKKPAFSWFPQDRTSDIYCEPFYTNTAKEVHFEPHSQMLNTQYLTYKQAWVEYALESGRWYTLSSPLQGVVSGDMYLPRGTAKQETPYFDPIAYNNADYTRLAPAVYQQAWDKAEATLYRLERDHLVDGKRLPATESLTPTANVARAFDWSYAYNDVKVPFGVNGFSVKVDVSRIEEYAKENGEKDVLLRLPKKDNTYNYYMYDDTSNGSTTADLTSVDGKNLREKAGRLFTDGMPAAGMIVTLTNNSADNPYFLVGNPFMSGLDLDKFFEVNTELEKKYWVLTKDSYSTGVKDESQNWTSTDNATAGDVAPLQAFFVKKSNNTGGTLDVTFTPEMAVQLTGEALQTRASGETAVLRLTAMRDGVESRAVVVCREEATEGFSAGEDVEALFDSNLSHAPALYTSAGEMAAAINVRRTLHGLPVGIASDDEDEVTLTFEGVEYFGEELYLYDVVEGISTPIPDSGTAIQVAGNSHSRYYLVTTPLDGSAQESVPVVKVQGRMVTVLSAFNEILSIEAFDAMGGRVYAKEAVGNRNSFTLPAQGVYLITVKTATGVFSHKVLVNF